MISAGLNPPIWRLALPGKIRKEQILSANGGPNASGLGAGCWVRFLAVSARRDLSYKVRSCPSAPLSPKNANVEIGVPGKGKTASILCGCVSEYKIIHH